MERAGEAKRDWRASFPVHKSRYSILSSEQINTTTHHGLLNLVRCPSPRARFLLLSLRWFYPPARLLPVAPCGVNKLTLLARSHSRSRHLSPSLSLFFHAVRRRERWCW